MNQRLDALRRVFRKQGISNFLVIQFEQFKQSHIRYLCGYSGSTGILLVTKREAFFLTDGRYTNQAAEEVKNARVITVGGGTPGGSKSNPEQKRIKTKPGIPPSGIRAAELFVREMRQNKAIRLRGRIGVEANAMILEFAGALRRHFPKCQLVETLGLIEDICAVKDDNEVACLRRAVKITDLAFEAVLGKIKPGMTERQIAAEISYQHSQLGAEKDSFEPIVASGPRSAFPHGLASERVVQKGDLITLDIGCFYQGYASDMTRTVVLGKASPEQRRVYNLVLEAQTRTCEAVKPGARGSDLDALARKIISDGGCGDNFTHGLGHGLGHYVHERPVLSARSVDILKPGNVVTVEPGIYIEGFGGVRIEDDVVVTDNGAEILNKSPKHLIEIN